MKLSKNQFLSRIVPSPLVKFNQFESITHTYHFLASLLGTSKEEDIQFIKTFDFWNGFDKYGFYRDSYFFRGSKKEELTMRREYTKGTVLSHLCREKFPDVEEVLDYLNKKYLDHLYEFIFSFENDGSTNPKRKLRTYFTQQKIDHLNKLVSPDESKTFFYLIKEELEQFKYKSMKDFIIDKGEFLSIEVDVSHKNR